MVGRSSQAHLRLSHPSVSAQHASLRWDDGAWYLVDLGSRNGTFLDGRRLLAGERVRLKPGLTIAFAAEPGTWQLDHDDGPGKTIGEGLPATVTTDATQNCRVADLRLEFAVSRNEEQVDIVMDHAGRVTPLRARAHHYLLLTLARLRLQDMAGEPANVEAHGWVDQETLLRMLAWDTATLNMHVFRARRQLAQSGVVDADNIVERRPTSRELRIGTANLAVQVV